MLNERPHYNVILTDDVTPLIGEQGGVAFLVVLGSKKLLRGSTL